MLHNHNQAVIKKISRRTLKMSPLRNLFLSLGIILTTILLTTVLTAGFTIFQTNKIYEVVSTSGVDADGYIDVNQAQYDQLKKHPAINDIGYLEFASLDLVKNPELLGANIILVAAHDQTIYDMMAIVPLEGNYPIQSNEILMPTWVLEALNLPRDIGQTISLELVINQEKTSIEFVMSGYYEAITPKTGQTKLFTHPSFIDTTHPAIRDGKDHASAFLTLKSFYPNMTYDEAKAELEQVAHSVGAEKFKVHPKYDPEHLTSSTSMMGQFLAVGAGILLIVLSGYLIIYNIFYISIIRDVKYYGLLKTIGMTHKQIKSLILKQAMTLSVIAIPIGLILGYFVGVVLTPLALKGTYFEPILIVSKHPALFILAAIFAIITVLISSQKPASLAAKVSPIEAVKYVSHDTASFRRVKSASRGIKLHVMAWHNLLKNKGRVILSILSIALSAALFMFVINLFMGVEGQDHANNQLVTDIEIRNHYSYYEGEAYRPISQDLINDIKHLPFVESVKSYYGAFTYSEFDGEWFGSFSGEFLNEGLVKDEFASYGNPDENYFLGFGYANQRKSIKTDLSSLQASNLETELERLRLLDGEIDSEAFSSGNYLIWLRRNGDEGVIQAGDKVPLSMIIRDEMGHETIIEREFEVMAIVGYPESGLNKGWVANNLGTITLEEEAFKSIYPHYDELIETVTVQLKPGTDLQEANDEVSRLVIAQQNSQLQLKSKLYYLEAMDEMKQTYSVVGIVLASILGFIGILNVTNTILSGIISRKMELTLLEAVGMTQKQIKTLLRWEGGYYILFTLLLMLPLGLFVSILSPMVLPIYGGFNLTIYLTSILVIMVMVTLLMLTLPLIGYRMISQPSIVERLREVE